MINLLDYKFQSIENHFIHNHYVDLEI